MIHLTVGQGLTSSILNIIEIIFEGDNVVSIKRKK